MVEITTEFDVICDECGANLDADFKQGWSRSVSSKLTIKPCEKCTDHAYARGITEGEAHTP